MRAEPIAPTQPRGQMPSKARHNAAELDDAVYLYSQNPMERRGLKGLGQDTPQSGETTRSTSQFPVEEHSWHASARRQLPPTEEAGKKRSRPLRTFSSTSRGSGMQYKPREENPPLPEPVHAQELQVANATMVGTKTRSRPFRKVIPKIGIIFPLGGPGHSTAGDEGDRVRSSPAASSSPSAHASSTTPAGRINAHAGKTDGPE